jgi:hypothetical protein
MTYLTIRTRGGIYTSPSPSQWSSSSLGLSDRSKAIECSLSLIHWCPKALKLSLVISPSILKRKRSQTRLGVIKLCCFHETNLVCTILFWTPIDVISMLLVNCCNKWCVVLNHYDLGLYVESCLKSFEISGLSGLWELKYKNLITLVIVLYLRSYNLIGSVTAGIRARFNTKHVICVFKTKVFVKTLIKY